MGNHAHCTTFIARAMVGVWRTEMRYAISKLAQALSDRQEQQRWQHSSSRDTKEHQRSWELVGWTERAESPEFVKKRAVALQGWLDLLIGSPTDRSTPTCGSRCAEPAWTPPRTSTSLHGEEQRHPPSPRGTVPSSDRSENGRVEPSHAVQSLASLSGNPAWQLVWEAPPEVDCDAVVVCDARRRSERAGEA